MFGQSTLELPGPVLIIGSGRNIGLGLARGLVSRGVNVALTWRSDPAPVETVARQVPQHVVHTGRYDASSMASVDEFTSELASKVDRLYGIINCVGPFMRKSLGKTSAVEFQNILQGNLVQAFASTVALRPLLAACGSGRVIWFSFAGADKLAAYRRIGAYAAAKTALVSLSRSLASEWAADRITVNTIAPGVVRGTDEIHHPVAAKDGVEPYVEVTDILSAVEFLLSDNAGGITGTNLTVSGGFGL